MATAGPLLVDGVQPVVLAVSHVAALALLLHWSRGVDPHDREAFTRFYLRVWALFFLEYLIVPAAALVG
jgi:homogentisate phytyltransferase/homogentisate geranylgeranyltransferase